MNTNNDKFKNFTAENHSQCTDQNSAEIDFSREKRCGFCEVIFGEGKSAEQIKEIAQEMLKNHQKVILATRVQQEKAIFLLKFFPDATYDDLAKTFLIGENNNFKNENEVIILTAGTSDLHVAKEAQNTLLAFGIKSDLINDVGVAGIHRIIEKIDILQNAKVIIVVAGMEGALPSVVGGLVNSIIIGVPTSIGYGASLNGFTPLLTMLSSCTSGITVTNIDNGFGAACAAKRVINNLHK